MADPQPRRFPVLWQVNARTTVRRFGPEATLDALDHTELDRLVPPGVDWVYLLGVWQTGTAGPEVSRRQADIRRSCESALPDLTDDDICGSCFAVTGYEVHERLGGADALAQLRSRLAQRGVALMLDFVPNHTAPDHPWVARHPERYIEGTDEDLAIAPANWTRVSTSTGPRVLALGRDPYFAGWPDTLQLDYSAPEVGAAMTDALLAAASHCDGLRCDMAMLVLPDVFERTWGRTMEPFWPGAVERVRAERPGFTFMAEVYWDREYDLQQQGFDLTYDKRLYDRLVGDLAGVREHLRADLDYQARSARFLENHDEPRAATTFGDDDRHAAAAAVTYLVPGLRFFEDGQRAARRIHVPVHLCRAPEEPDRAELADLYDALLDVLADPVLHDGTWQLADVNPAWEDNTSNERVVAFTWSTGDSELRYIVVVNLADDRSQGHVDLDHSWLADRQLVLIDRLGPERYERDGNDLLENGLYVDVGPWAHHVFAVSA
jgi:Alpha amylase, catalytic domain